MANLIFPERELKGERFRLFCRGVGHREDTALGFLLLFWRRTQAANLVVASTPTLSPHLSCDLSEAPRYIEAMLAAGYLQRMDCGPVVNATVRIVGNEDAIVARDKRRVKTRAAGRARVAKYGSPKSRHNTPGYVPGTKAQELVVSPPAPVAAAAPARRPSTPTLDAHRATWDAYATRFRQVTGQDPVRNAKQNALIKQLCQRLPHADAPNVVRFYVGHRHTPYRERLWPLDLCVKDAESLYTQSRTRREVTREDVIRVVSRERQEHELARGAIF